MSHLNKPDQTLRGTTNLVTEAATRHEINVLRNYIYNRTRALKCASANEASIRKHIDAKKAKLTTLLAELRGMNKMDRPEESLLHIAREQGRDGVYVEDLFLAFQDQEDVQWASRRLMRENRITCIREGLIQVRAIQ